jgi:hypothetical protein
VFILLCLSPGLTLKNSTLCLHSVFICFVCTSEEKAIISVHRINWPVFIIERDYIYCAVRAGYLNVIQVKFRLPIVQSSANKQNITWESIMEFFLLVRLPVRCQHVSGNSRDRASQHCSSWFSQNPKWFPKFPVALACFSSSLQNNISKEINPSL